MFNQTSQILLSPLRLSALALCCLLVTSPLSAKERAPDFELRNLLISAINDSESFQDRFEAEVW